MMREKEFKIFFAFIRGAALCVSERAKSREREKKSREVRWEESAEKAKRRERERKKREEKRHKKFFQRRDTQQQQQQQQQRRDFERARERV